MRAPIQFGGNQYCIASFAGARFSSVDGNEKHVDILDALNDRVDQIMNDIEQVAPRRGGQIDLSSGSISDN